MNALILIACAVIIGIIIGFVSYELRLAPLFDDLEKHLKAINASKTDRLSVESP